MAYALGFEEAVCLGLLQGLTEFLPLSSDAHVALAETLLDVGSSAGSDNAERLTLHACLRAGTLLAGLFFFHERIAAISISLFHSLRAGRLPDASTAGGDAVLIALASLPMLGLGLLLQPALASWQGRPLALGFGLILSALWLTSSLWAGAGAKTSMTLRGAALLGTAQGIAWLPGLSRSGASLVCALWLGLRAERAFELALLATLPGLGCALAFDLGAVDHLEGSLLALAAGTFVAFGAGLAGLYLLRRVVQSGHVAWGALWLLPVALASLALAKAWPR
jgi:undecaprenyl-diphosphatase